MIYQPSGDSIRYYDMNSDAPLRDIFISTFFLDMNGNIQDLQIEQGYVGSIKLHFRLKQYKIS